MKLDRSVTKLGYGKYAAINMRRYDQLPAGGAERDAAGAAMQTLQKLGLLDHSDAGNPEEFFLIKLKDKFAVPALDAYAQAVVSAAYDCSDDVPPDEGLLEYFRDVNELVERAANHPLKKQPD
jgi:hypothetical protein